MKWQPILRRSSPVCRATAYFNYIASICNQMVKSIGLTLSCPIGLDTDLLTYCLELFILQSRALHHFWLLMAARRKLRLFSYAGVGFLTTPVSLRSLHF